MRHVHLGLFVAATFSFITAAAAIGCTATGSSTVFGDGTEGGSPFDFEDSGTSDGGTTKKDSATSESTDYEALFGPPSSTTATPDSLKGLWAGTGPNGQDMRLRFGTSSIVIALKCFSKTAIGMSVAASVSSSAIKTLESKKLGDASTCGLTVTPDELTSCATASFPCFTLNGTKLDLDGFLGTAGSFTKLSD